MRIIEEIRAEDKNARSCEAPHPVVTVEGPVLARNAIARIRLPTVECVRDEGMLAARGLVGRGR